MRVSIQLLFPKLTFKQSSILHFNSTFSFTSWAAFSCHSQVFWGFCSTNIFPTAHLGFSFLKITNICGFPASKILLLVSSPFTFANCAPFHLSFFLIPLFLFIWYYGRRDGEWGKNLVVIHELNWLSLIIRIPFWDFSLCRDMFLYVLWLRNCKFWILISYLL